MFCPKCAAEYRPGFTKCVDCGVDLLDELPKAGPPQREEEGDRPAPCPDLELVSVFRSSDASRVAIAKSLLESAGIEFMVRGDLIEDLFGYGRCFAPDLVVGPVEFQVSAEDAETARSLLEGLGAGREETNAHEGEVPYDS